MQNVDSLYVMKIEEFIKTENFYAIIVEFANGGTLNEFLSKRPLEE